MTARFRRGITLVEVILGVAILAGSLIPIAYYFANSNRQQSNLKAEAAAAGYMGQVMNTLLSEIPFDDLGTVPASLSGNITLDNTTIQWNAAYTDIAPASITFTWTPLGANVNDTGSATAAELDRKNAGQPALKDIVVTFQWQGPRDTAMGGPSRTQTLVTRRARL